jgi:hypothetical protein
MKLKPGDTVRVIGSRATAKMRAILTSIHGALLETQIDGFRRWNLDELRLGEKFPLPYWLYSLSNVALTFAVAPAPTANVLSQTLKPDFSSLIL